MIPQDFLGNRIGVFAMQVAMTEAFKMKLSIEEADAIFGRPMGIPKTGVFGLYDLIGIDLMADVLKSFIKELSENDPFQEVAREIPLVKKLIETGYTGRKGKGGFYRVGERSGGFEGLGSFGAFLAVFSIMVGYFAAVVINFGDFARFVKNEDEMKKGNLWGLVGNVILFSFITLMITGGTIAIFGEYVSSPTEMVAKVDNLGLTIIAAFAFFAATVGINMVANFIPPAYDLANLMPSKINFKTGGLITAGFGFVIGGMWVAVITQMGLFPFVNTLGAILAPVFGIMITDYYIIKKEKLDVDALFDAGPKAKYHYSGGFNHKAILAWVLSGYIAVGTVWPNILVLGLGDFFANLGGGGGYAWIIGASLGAVVHLAISKR